MNGFTLIVEGLDLDNETQNAALEYLPYDIVASRSNGVVTVDVECDGIEPSDSVVRVYEDLKKIDVVIVRIDLDLVSLSEIAERANINRETARLWSSGARRSDFPAPFTVAGGSKLWAWAEIHGWLLAKGVAVDGIYDWTPLSVDMVETFNGAFAQKRDGSSDGWMVSNAAGASLHLGQTTSLVMRTGWVTA